MGCVGMSEFVVNPGCSTESKPFQTRPEAEDAQDSHIALCGECESEADAPIEPKGVEVVEDPDQASDAIDVSPEEYKEELETQSVDPEELSKNPIGFLRDVDEAFVNTISGKPAISKQGFRFIQREFEISTESEVVQWSEDPLGCVVWAKAELPNGYAAEAHGEGYQFEADVSDNEFVRYADTRAKNRALSDLTSAGALAVSELQGDGSE